MATQPEVKSPGGQAGENRQLARIRWLQGIRAAQDRLYRNAGTQGLTWDVILLIAEADLSGRPLSVSDVCVTVSASKSTTLKLIARLMADGVVAKRRKPGDSRTHLLALDETFRPRLDAFLDAAAGDVPG